MGPVYIFSMKRALFIPVLLMASMLLLVNCKEIALPPPGSYSEILLVTEDGRQSKFLNLILQSIDRELDYYTGREKQFDVSIIPAQQLEDFPQMKTIMIVGVVDELTSIGQEIAMLIGEAGVRKVAGGEATILKRENMPAPGQMTLIVTARSDAELETVLRERGDEIPAIIEESARKRLRRYLITQLDKELGRYLYRTYGFAIEIPTFYRLESESKHPPGVELIREPPTRSLGIFWADWDRELALADSLALFAIRSDYVFERYNGDAMDSTRVAFSWIRLGPYHSIEMAGYWYSTSATAGGAYRTYFIYEEEEKLLWALDNLVFAPGRSKHPLFRELRALAETFRYD
jgi:hypothetical protein